MQVYQGKYVAIVVTVRQFGGPKGNEKKPFYVLKYMAEESFAGHGAPRGRTPDVLRTSGLRRKKNGVP